MKESARLKGLRYLVDGRLIIREVNPATGYVYAECRGDTGEIHVLGYDPWRKEVRCSCPARTQCSHIYAMLSVVTIPRPENGAPHATVASPSPSATAAPAT